jgi:hypothetical protein
MRIVPTRPAARLRVDERRFAPVTMTARAEVIREKLARHTQQFTQARNDASSGAGDTYACDVIIVVTLSATTENGSAPGPRSVSLN